MKKILLKSCNLGHLLKTIAAVMLLLGTVQGVEAQQIQRGNVTGKVLDSSEQPVIGASVVIVGTTTGTTTGVNGEFQLQANAGQELSVSFVGMTSRRVPVSFTPMKVVLSEEATVIDEAVVIGYGTAKKRDLTGSIVNVSAQDIANRPSANPIASLQGRVAGVQITNTGRAGQDPEIRIRGTNSINGFTPLYVVDGMFTDNINFLNTNDIESFEILKDPSSLAIFGVRGANGVIIITTRKAKEGQTVVSINQAVSIKHVGNRLSLTNGPQFKMLYDEQLVNMGNKPFDYTNYQANTDWQDAIFQNAVVSQTTASVSSSSANNNFYLGVGYTYEQGNIKKEEMQKVTVNFGDDYKMNKWLKFGVKVNGSYFMPVDAKNVDAASRAVPISPIYAPNGDYYALPAFQSTQMKNPMIDVEEFAGHAKAQNYRFAGNVYGEINFLPQLKFRAAFSFDYTSNNLRKFEPVAYEYDPAVGKTSPRSLVETLSQEKANTVNAQQDYILTYADTFAEKHNLTLMAGMTTNYTNYELLKGARSQNIEDADILIPNDPDKWWISSIGDISTATNDGSTQYNRFTLSFLLRGLYNYDNRYLINASYRRDGASVFKYTGNTWDNFYSVGGGWVISEEKFMKSQNVIDFLKIKGSYGVLGNQNIGESGGYYPAFPTLNASSAVFGDNIITAYSPKYLATNLRWEKTKAWEIGFELQMLSNRLRIDPTYYSKKTDDLICYLEKFMGAQDGLINSGSIRNRGFELAASWSDKIGKDFRYSVSGNLTTINNKVLSLGKTYYQGDKSVAVSEKGMPIGYFYGYDVEGVYQSAEDIANSPENTLAKAAPGDLKFRDVNGDGRITDADRTKIGNPTPDFTYGFSLNLQYKNFDLTADFQGVSGNEIFNTGFLNAFAQYNYNTKRLGRWHGEGTSNWEPLIESSRSLQKLNSSYYVEDGSYLRLKNIQLGYNFSKTLLRKIHLKALRVYFNIDNLKTWSHNTGYTPEIGGTALAFGIDTGATYPMPSTYTFGVNVSF